MPRIHRRAGDGRSPARLAWPAIAMLLVACAGCGGGDAPREPEPATMALEVDVRADTGATTLRVEPPEARVWVERVSESPPAAPIAPPVAGEAELPEADPAPVPRDLPPAPALKVDADLKPPVLKHRAPLAVPVTRPRRTVTIEVDVLVNEQGEVAEVTWAGGSPDTALVRAALDCARAMQFYPALRAGNPVAVWCRQRFDFGGR